MGLGGNTTSLLATPTGLCPKPKVAVLGYLGNGSDDSRNPNRVAAGLHVESAMNSDSDSRQTDPIGYAGRLGHNPGGVGELAAVFPRVAEYSNPGLEDGSPSGKPVRRALTSVVTYDNLDCTIGMK